MADGVKIFGFEIKKSAEVKRETEPLKDASVVPPTDDDGAGYVTSGANHYGMAMDIYGDLTVKDQHDLIRKYRIAAQQPEVDMAIEEIVNEAIVVPQTNDIVVDIDLDLVDVSVSIKKKVAEEFRHLLNIMDFDARCHDMFRCWYVDGRLYHHLVVDKDNLKAGIKEVRYIDSLKIRKVRHIKKNTNKEGVVLVADVEEFYIFNDTIVGSGQGGANGFSSAAYGSGKNSGVKLSNDSVSYVTSGLLDDTRTKVVSNLQKSLRVINQLRMMEDSLIIYRMARAPERRIFYVDTGNLPKAKAEEYLNSLMTRYRNKLVYDGNTGELKDSRKHMTMLDDFWLPRREGGRGTEVSTLPGGSNLGEIDDIKYFQRKVYQSLNVPVSRLEQEQAYSIGRATEITREEIKFQKFVTRLRMRFSKLFTGILKQQLILKGIITEVDWHDKFSNRVRIDYYKDNHYTELKDAEVMRERLGLMDQAVQYVGEYLSKDWVMTNIMQLDNEEKVAMNLQMKKEIASGEIDPDGDDGEGAEDNTSAGPQAPEVTPIKPSKEKEEKDVDAKRVANAPEERQG